jgi:hypothetical protein
MTITNQPSGKKKAASSAVPNRLPSARERRPALAALAVLLIAGGAVLAGWLALRQSQTESYLMVKQEVLEGNQIERSDLTPVELPKEGVSFIPASQSDQVVGGYAQTDLLEGTVLVPDVMVDDLPAQQVGKSRIGLELGPDQYPPGLNDGDTINLLLLAGSGEVTSAVLKTTGLVISIDAADTGNGAVLGVELSDQCSDQFASASPDSNVALQQVSPRDKVFECAPAVSSGEGPK